MNRGPGWHLVTGEYPPQLGGVSDYSAQLAAGLAARGPEVHVWTVPADGETPGHAGVTVHRVAGRWLPPDLARLDAALERFEPPRRLLVQYAPNAWGRKGLNFHFTRWLVRRGRLGDDVRVMFHECWYPLELRDKPARWLLSIVQRGMARALVRSSSRVYVSIPAWEERLRRFSTRPIAWFPVPSNVPAIEDGAGVERLRRRIAPRGERIVGSFGTFGERIAPMLRAVLPAVLKERPNTVGLLIGRGGKRFADRLIAAGPELSGRLTAPGGQPPEEVSRLLQACDLLVQPYPDGVTSRRGSVMAGLAHGRAIVTTSGPLSEPIWAERGGAILVPAAAPSAMVQAASALLDDPLARDRLGRAALRMYEQSFTLRRTIEALESS